jgi:putative heme-binding domain-containing protein
VVIEKTLALMDASPEPAEQIWYALCLREASGWTPAQRERYFAWFAKARGYKGGNSFAKFILRIRDQALEKLPAADRPALLALAEKEVAPQPAAPAAPPRAFVKAWTLADLLPALPEADKGRNFARGKALYTAAQCAQCHQFAGEGGATGPDLTAVGSRFSRKDILEAILDPSKALSEQYASFLFTMKDGSVVAGQIAEENHYLLTLILNPITGERQNFPKGNIVKREMSPVSLMPPGLLSTLTRDEVLDLLAYLESAGNDKAPSFGEAR